ncbi:M23 family metallopeptidase [Ruminococcaceae bacterium OttesenSCG-928-A16]|nr:M23 family metallopeptidase [Ruminococcaceae bacterium OttesenSCG-928-A16]
MKRLGIILLVFIIAVPCILGGILLVSYNSTTEDTVPLITITAAGQTCAPSSYTWHQPLIAGIMVKDFATTPTLESKDLGRLTQPTLPLVVSEPFTSETVTLFEGNAQQWAGTLQQWNTHPLTASGTYVLEVVLTQAKPEKGTDGYGSFTFRLSFTIQLEPTLTTSNTRVEQGDVLALVASQLEGRLPTAETTLEMTGSILFTATEDGQAKAFIPIAHNREPGDYTATVRVGETVWEVPFTVVAAEFTRQDLTIDTSNPVIGEANSAAAYQQYRDKIYPMFETADPETYWEGAFLKPAEGNLSTEYGLRRYTNGATTPTRHVGIDIAAAENAPVKAPANGRVVLAEYLLNTGNTLVIEHGAGLKSYFFHMNELSVTTGSMVAKGDEVGLVGSTGYSTGPHLHYEVRIGNQSISPMLLFNGEGQLFFAAEATDAVA